MDKDILLHQLENLAEMLGIEIRYEAIENELPFSSGGLCRIGKRHVVIINKRLPEQEKISALARAVARFDLTRVYLRPGLREFIAELQGNAGERHE